MPTPFFGAAITELTSVPCSSSTSPTVCRFIKIVFAREANSGCVMSMPESTIVTGFPGPGASTRSAPIAARPHSLGTSGSVGCSAALVLTRSRSGCATTTAPAARSRASVRASTRPMCSSGTSPRAPARRARSVPAPGFSCARSARAGAALASRTTVTISRRLAKAPTVVAVPRSAGSWRPRPRGYTQRHEPPRRARRVRGRTRDPPEEGVHGGLRALPLLRPHAGRHLSLQPPRPRAGVPAELPVLPSADGGRLGLGQEPAHADHPARRGVDVQRCDRRGAARRGRGLAPHRRGARREDRRVALRRRRHHHIAPVLLAIDVGNTSTVFGLFDGSELTEHWRVATERHKSGDELGALYRNFLDLDRVRGIVLSSTVPQLVRSYQEFATRYTAAELLELGPGVKTGVPIRYDDPREGGPDRIANAVAAAERYGAPCIVVDFGTSTNFDVVSAAGEYVGGVLAPGIEISMDALFARAARLGKVAFAGPETVIGRTTATALQSGLVYGFAGQVDGIVGHIRAELDA